ncbi:MAG: Serine/threonine-protein kinase PknD [Syntrophus sp. SKADARSKE-3]|nr:Serine/threonine-protein kinase PknD [Syntrophus sp. SKADARSKE-3]
MGIIVIEHIDRFKILKELGHGAQGIVYLAEDPRLERAVAIKTIDRLLSAEQGIRLMDEARTISKMRHPNIVSVYEAGDIDGKPYVVFEYVEGISLRERIKKDSILPVREAVSMMIQILDGMDYAHKMGIIHRDLSPANIMLDRHGVARIMDFGLSVMIGGDVKEAAGTPYYMSPEHFSGAPLNPRADIFSLGLVFYEMVTGRPAFTGDNNFTLMYRIAHDPLVSPSRYNKDVDTELDNIILNAMEKRPEDRYEDAAEMKQSLESYLEPDEQTQIRRKTRDAHGTVQFLIRRMRHKGDLPAFSKHIIEINGKLSSLKALTASSSGELSNIILKDFSLTNKLLQVVNSAHYGGVAGRVTTISRAILVIGFERLRIVACALMIFEHLQDINQAAELKEVALTSFLSGLIATDTAEKMKLGHLEHVFICAMLYYLGKMLVICYFPEEYEEIKAQINKKGMGEERAARSILAISYNELGMAVSHSWNFPDLIVRSMQGPPRGLINPPRTDQEMLQNLSGYAHELSEIIIKSEGTEREHALSDMEKRYQQSIPLPADQMIALVESAAVKMDQFSRLVKIDAKESILMRRLASYRQDKMKETGSADSRPGELTKIQTLISIPAKVDDTLRLQLSQLVADGIYEISEAMKGKHSFSDIIYMIMETMYRGFAFNRILFCMRDSSRPVMVARFGLGDQAEQLVHRFQFTIGNGGDIFNIAISQGKGITIDDAETPTILGKLPQWYRNIITTSSFLIYPLVVQKTCIGLFYADKENKGALLTEDQRNAMDTLCRFAISTMVKR